MDSLAATTTVSRFGSVCSGIEAASVALGPIGFEAAWFSEIEPFPCAMLKHHYPKVPNLGDMTTLPARIAAGEVEAPDLFCGGTPCQAFSVAGLRNSLEDARGNLSIVFCAIANAVDAARLARGEQPAVIKWENVPGVLSTKDNAFGCFLAGLAGEDDPLVAPGGKWTNAGCVFGPKRTVAWRITDAQYFGVAQRRRRVFVVASAREGFDPTAVLFEFDGVRRDTAPSREAGQEITLTIRAGAANGGAGHGARSGDGKDELIVPVAFGGNDTRGPIDIATARNACASASGRMDFESETFLVCGTLNANGKAAGSATQQDAESGMLIPVLAFDTTQITSLANRSSPKVGDPCHALAAGAHAPAIAFHPTQDPISSIDGSTHALGCGSPSGQASIAVAIGWDNDLNAKTELMGTLLKGGAGGRHEGVAYTTKLHNTQSNQAGKIYEEYTTALDRSSPPPALLTAMQVRRLTPRECERLQGFPDDYTLIPYGRTIRMEKLTQDWIKYLLRGGVMTLDQVCQAAADGPRYKALGNSWAVPNIRWIGERIKAEMLKSNTPLALAEHAQEAISNVVKGEL